MNRVTIINRGASCEVVASQKKEKMAQRLNGDQNNFVVVICYLAEERLI